MISDRLTLAEAEELLCAFPERADKLANLYEWIQDDLLDAEDFHYIMLNLFYLEFAQGYKEGMDSVLNMEKP